MTVEYAISPLTAENLSQAFALCQRIELPHCWPVRPEAFARTVLPAVMQEHESAWIGYAQNEPVCFMHVCDTACDDHGQALPGLGGVRFFYHVRGRHRLAMEMLRLAEDWFLARGLGTVRVMHYNEKYPFFHLRHTHLPAKLDHVHALFSACGYAMGECELAYEWPGLDLPPLDASPVPLENVEVKEVPSGGIHPNVEVRCLIGGELVAICLADSAVSISGDSLLPGHVCDAAVGGHCTCSNDLTPSDVAYIKWLQVDEAMQSRGLGRWTLMKTLGVLRDLGYRNATICVLGHNYHPWLMYSGGGFQLVDWSWTRTKVLT